MRTLVSTKTLSGMPVFAAGGNRAAQVEALIEKRHGLPVRRFVSSFFFHHLLDTAREKPGDRGAALGRENLRAAHGLGIETNRQVLLRPHKRMASFVTSRVSRVPRNPRVRKTLSL